MTVLVGRIAEWLLPTCDKKDGKREGEHEARNGRIPHGPSSIRQEIKTLSLKDWNPDRGA